MDAQQKAYAEMLKDNAELLRQNDKLLMLNDAILAAITDKGSLTKDEYNRLYAETVRAWQAKQATPNN